MGQEAYKKLAEKLDQLPNRYKETESGIELRLLEKLFTLEEANLAAEMSANKESAAAIAERESKCARKRGKPYIERYGSEENDLFFQRK